MLINNIRKSPTCPIRNTIHAPTRGATSAVAWKWKLHIISIHAPTRGATPYGLLTANVRLFQSTLLQEERPVLVKRSHTIHQISIHAPTRGATWEDDFLWWYIKHISIHAPTRGATQNQPFIFSILSISIHAPTRGATISFAVGSTLSIFQSTLLQEERPKTPQLIKSVKDFNPRSYKRSDNNWCSPVLAKPLFQSTLLQEERQYQATKEHLKYLISIHAPTRGATAKMHNIPHASLQ